MKNRVQILSDLDIAAARKALRPELDGMSDYGILVGMHKTRLHLKAVPYNLRKESLDWLRERGFQDLGGGPLLSEVPEGVH